MSAEPPSNLTDTSVADRSVTPANGGNDGTGVLGSLLLIGPLPVEGDQLGGAKVSFRQMTADLSARADVHVDAVNLSRPMLGRGPWGRRVAGVRAAIAVAFALVRQGRKADVWALNCSSGGVFTLLPLVWSLAALLRRPLVLRVFGGNLDSRHDAAGPAGRRAFGAMARRCRAVVLQTRTLVTRFEHLDNVRWLPTTRALPPGDPPRERCSRLVFLGQIRREKGIEVLLDALSEPMSGVHVDCYGSAVDPTLIRRMEGQPGIDYGGEVKPDEIGALLRQYDALVLPTFWDGEGLPGVVVEAFQCGRPVIASDWRGLPELVTHEVDGLLVAPRSPQALRAAIERLAGDTVAYARLCAGARTAGEELRSDVWHARFVGWCFT